MKQSDNLLHTNDFHLAIEELCRILGGDCSGINVIDFDNRALAFRTQFIGASDRDMQCRINSPQSGELFIGRGMTDDLSSEGIAIDWKTCTYSSGVAGGNRRFRSISRLVTEVDQETLEKWRERLSFNGFPIGTTIVVEDFSPDTCVAFALLFCRLQGVTVFPDNWLAYIDSWEEGHLGSQNDPRRSFGCLLSSLGHGYWDQDPASSQDSDLTRTGFCACVAFAARILALGVDPDDIPPNLAATVPYHSTALALLDQERQLYLQAISHADLVQLALPIKGTTRTLLVDAFITSEVKLAGTFKAFLRRDAENSWLKNGFALLALYQPKLQGTGSDMVVSVSAELGVTLKNLHEELEKRETIAWSGCRPADHPRSGFAFNEPWYVTGDETLVAAPRWVDRNAGTLGTKLTWHTDVLGTLWQLYNPLRTVNVRSYLNPETIDDSAMHLSLCRPMRSEYGKYFKAIAWDRNGTENSLLLSPTVLRYLAACITTGGESGIGLSELPAKESFDVVKIVGGLVVIHNNGVLLLNDWTRDSVAVENYVNEFDRVLRRHRAIEEHTKTISEKVIQLRERIADRKSIDSAFVTDLSQFVFEQKIRVREAIFSTIPSVGDHDLANYRNALEARWALREQLDDLYESLTEIESIARSALDRRTNQIITAVTVFGYPPFMLAGLFAFIFQPGGNQTGDDYVSLGLLKLHWMGLFIYIAISFGLVLVLRWLLRKR